MDLAQKTHFIEFTKAIKNDPALIGRLIKELRHHLQPDGDDTCFSAEHYPLVMSYVFEFYPNHKIYAEPNTLNSGTALEKQFRNFRISEKGKLFGHTKYPTPYFAWLCRADSERAKAFYNYAFKKLALNQRSEHRFKVWEDSPPRWSKAKLFQEFKTDKEVWDWRTKPYLRNKKRTSSEAPDDQEGIERDLLDPYNMTGIPFQGRKHEIERLNAFADGPGEFKIWTVIAPSGAGKTRLTYEWTQRSNIKDYWNVLYLGQDAIGDLTFRHSNQLDYILVEGISAKGENWDNWSPKDHKDTIFIIDYVFGYREVIDGLVNRCVRLNHGLPSKVRLLVLDHIFPNELEDIQRDLRWEPLERDVKRSIFYEEKPLLLTKTTDQHEIMPAIIRYAAGERPEDDEASIIKTEVIDDAIAYLKNTKGTWRPLFAALVGNAIKNDRAYDNFDRRNLIKTHLSGTGKLPWKSPGNRQHGLWASMAVCTSTARRGALKNDIVDAGYGPSADSPEDFLPIFDLSERIVSRTHEDVLFPYEPDILGESFFLLFLDRVKTLPSAETQFSQMLSCGRGALLREGSKEFLSFLERLFRNLLNDDQSILDTKRRWKNLEWFLNPKRFPHGSPFQWAISVALISLFEIRKQEETHLESLLNQSLNDSSRQAETSSMLFNRIESSSLCRNVPSELLWRTTKAALTYLSIGLSKGHITEPISKDFLHLFSRFEAATPKNHIIKLAIQTGSTKLVSTLIEHGYIVDKDDKSRTSTFAMSLWHSDQMSIMLLEKGAKIETDNHSLSGMLLAAIGLHCEKTAVKLIKIGANPNSLSSKSGLSVLGLSIRLGQQSVSQQLIASGADVNCFGKEDMTPLIMACMRKQNDLAFQLIHAGANIDQQIKGGVSALFIACMNKDSNLALEMLSHGASLSLKLDDGSQPLFFAVNLRLLKLIETMLKSDADVNNTNKLGQTALQAAVNSNEPKIVKLILRENPDLNSVFEIENTRGTALDLAFAIDNQKVSDVLIAAGAKTASEVHT